MSRIRSCLTLILSLVTSSAIAQTSVAVLGSAAITSDSLGKSFVKVLQSEDECNGVAVAYRRAFRAFSIQGSYGAGLSSEILTSVTGRYKWGIARHEFAVQALRSLGAWPRVRPFVGGGAGMLVVYSRLTSLDTRPEILLSGGSDIRLTAHLSLRSELVGHLFRAFDYGDQSYHAARTSIIEPRFGVVWNFRKKGPSMVAVDGL